MQLFMMWMSGNSIQIFSIMFLGMTFYNSLKNVVNVNQSACPLSHSVPLVLMRM